MEKLTRRLFLGRSAAVSAVTLTGAAVAVEAASASSTVHNLIASHAAAKALAKEADAIGQAIYKKPGRPPYPEIDLKEIGWAFRPGVWRDKTLDRSDIPELMKGRRFSLTMMRDLVADCEGTVPDTYQAKFKANMAAVDAEEARLNALLDERQAIRDRWEIESGMRAADEQTETLWERTFAIHDEILAFDCETIDDVRGVAGFIRTEYDDQLSAEAANEFIAGLAKMLP